MREHRLRREIAATQIVNNMLHGGGTTFAFRLHEETGAPAAEIARAYAVARDIFQMRPQWGEIEALDNRVSAEVQIEMLLEGRRLIERGSRWLLRNLDRPIAIAPAVRHFEAGAAALYESVPRLLDGPDAEPIERRAAELRESAVPDRLAMRVASLGTMFAALDIVQVADETGLDVESVAAVHFQVGAAFSCTGCGTASSSSLVTIAGVRSPAPRCATTFTVFTARSPRRSCEATGSRTTPPRRCASGSTAIPHPSAASRRWRTSASAAPST